MRPLQFLCRNPLSLLFTLVVAFVGWVCWDAVVPPSEPEGLPMPENLSHNRAAFTVRVLELPDEMSQSRMPSKGRVAAAANAFPKLKAGMTRTEVEGLVGTPVPGNISPATVADGRVVYHTHYEADLTPPATVRPIGRPRSSLRSSTPKELVTLEFDATKPGHPLVGVYYPDPLF